MWSRREALRALPVLAAGVGAAGCGYALAGRGSFLPDYIQTLGIPTFGNVTPYATVELVFTQRVRTEFWGYAADEALSTDELIKEAYRGIRPAPGYPACPEHGIKRDMFRVLQAESIGMGLTESMAMTPAASVSGFYLAHPQAQYFNVGRIGDDQLQDWAQRQELAVDDARRHLAPSLQ